MALHARPYVDLTKAVRVVVRLMPDGETLARFMPDAWITGRMARWTGVVRLTPDMIVEGANDPTMVALYGKNWRAVRPKVVKAYSEACALLEEILPSGKVRGKGISCAREGEPRRDITPDEWSSFSIELKRNLLATPPGKNFTDDPAIRSVIVSTEDIKREARALLALLKGSGRGVKRAAVCETIDRLGLEALERMSQKEREFEIIGGVKERFGGLTVSDRFVRSLFQASRRKVPS
jgi:hypothetical protein